ncbi:extra-cytoplasmic solute receptor (plasmid) [Cupriavidus necator N-1]|uniref:Extra-cytoplasmic solute receptor n=1 Tax=Cupriavidus necator (strain ATCC 43291 / DSM 13513 / CCUG 52238 / LMG 8453 / N-1) TaxID=1042878 RepID=F8GYF3_CUPNN|nr:tripartite tricarboxylate transporter substrate binding protein [Cupriavidus necator]AEI82894.1 extra-cytoplasmic solute receptor [Cupriavidus necator N-1]MDX6008690.1 tripartite tricarboxylate transporter substrate binding protein [Cupriavidus necator]
MKGIKETTFRLLCAGGLAPALLISSAVWASGYPVKPVTLIVPQAPGGANDAVARIVAQRLGAVLGQPIVVDNRPGAGGNIGIQVAAKAPHDGYTLLLTVGSSFTINPSLYRKIPFDPVKDFEPITLMATAPYLLVTNPAIQARSVQDLIGLARSKPGKLDYASAGNGTLNHLLGEMLKAKAGIDITHVPYKSAAAAATDVVAGQVPITFGSLPGVMPFVKTGQLRVLGVATEKRSRLIPEVPTIGEAIPGYSAISWYGLLAPAGTPKEILAQLHADATKVLNSKDVQDKLAAQGAEAASNTPEQFRALIKEDLVKWAKVVKDSGAQVD